MKKEFKEKIEGKERARDWLIGLKPKLENILNITENNPNPELEAIKKVIEPEYKEIDKHIENLERGIAHHAKMYNELTKDIFSPKEKKRKVNGKEFFAKVYSPTSFKKEAKEIYTDAKNNEYNLTLTLLDLDHLKEINDTQGHQKGDEVIGMFAQVITDFIEPEDKVYRIGGDEFALFLPKSNIVQDRYHHMLVRENNVVNVVENIRRVMEAKGHTISAGIANYKQNAKNFTDLINKSDKALYESKENGRNRITFYKDQTE